jgi:predicted transcriptional regulator
MSDSKSIKQKIIEMLQRLPDDIDYDRAIESIMVYRKIEIGLEQADRGEVIEHEELMRELLGEDEEISSRMDAAS